MKENKILSGNNNLPSKSRRKRLSNRKEGYTILYLKGFYSNSYHHGLQLNAGLSYDIRKRLFLKIQYDFINFKDEKEKTLEWANKKGDINVIKLGIGFRF